MKGDGILGSGFRGSTCQGEGTTVTLWEPLIVPNSSHFVTTGDSSGREGSRPAPHTTCVS